MQDVLTEILRSQAHVAAGLFALWLVIGIVAGLVAGALAGLVLWRTGALGLRWKHAVWLRVLSCFWTLAAGVLFGGSIGSCEGTLRGTEEIVRESQFRTEGLRRAGEAVCGAVAWIDLALENHLAKRDLALREDQVAEVDAFLKGGREFDVRAFRGRLERTEEELVRKVADSAAADVRMRMGFAPGGVPDTLMLHALRRLARYGLRKAVESPGLEKDVEGLFGALEEAARAKGDPATAALPELAEAVVERSLIPILLVPARALARGPQVTALLLTLAAFLLPALGFWAGRRFEARQAKSIDTPPAAGYPPGEGGGV